MIRIDAHHHLWKYSPHTHGWIDEGMQELKRDFLPENLWTEMKGAGYHGCVSVQASQSETETRFLLEQAEQHPFIKGVVGWLDLLAPDLKEKLENYSEFPVLKGLRHVIQDEPDDLFMLRDDFLNGIAMLQPFGLTYDILIFPRHLETARKISGMVTEAKWKLWKPEEFVPYLDVVYEAFGAERLMIGSDWPVCLLSGSYREVMQIAEDYLANCPGTHRVLGRNAIDFYNLEVG